MFLLPIFVYTFVLYLKMMLWEIYSVVRISYL